MTSVKEAVERYIWLADNKCPHCVHGGTHDVCLGDFKIVPLKGSEGYRCYGYRSRYWDEGKYDFKED